MSRARSISCPVCVAVITEIDNMLSNDDRKSPDKVEKVMQKYCDSAKGKDKTMVRYALIRYSFSCLQLRLTSGEWFARDRLTQKNFRVLAVLLHGGW